MNEVRMGREILLCTCEITEDDSVWPEISEVLKAENIDSFERTVFTRDEVDAAEWVELNCDNVQGFPEPSEDGSWRDLAFDCTKRCSTCGIGMVQKGPIHLGGEPQLGEGDFMTIEWTYDIFARPGVLDILVKNGIMGFEVYPAISHSSGQPLETVRQMKVTGRLGPSLITDTLTQDKTRCGDVKYHEPRRGMLKLASDKLEGVPDLAYTHEWFGSGHTAIQLILGSKRFVHLYFENNWRGLTFQPVELV